MKTTPPKEEKKKRKRRKIKFNRRTQYGFVEIIRIIIM